MVSNDQQITHALHAVQHNTAHPPHSTQINAPCVTFLSSVVHTVRSGVQLQRKVMIIPSYTVTQLHTTTGELILTTGITPSYTVV